LNILGFNCYMHDAASALLSDGRIVCAVAEERFARRKHVGDFPAQAIRCCLDAGGLRAQDLDHVTFFYKPWLGVGRRVLHALRNLPDAADLLERRGAGWLRFRNAERAFRLQLGLDGGGPRFHFVEHHLAHAASAFLLSPFAEAAILSVDGAGEWATTLLAQGSGRSIRKLGEVCYPHSLGNVYSAFTQYLGFRPNSGEGKVMGLAPYGDPDRYIDEFRKIIRLIPEGGFEIDLGYFQHHLGKERRYGDRVVEVFGAPREPESEMTRNYENVAAALQRRLEEAILHLARGLQRQTGLRKLCMAGGVALNSVANGRILHETDFEEIFIQPAASDDGTSLGSALFQWSCVLGNERPEPLTHASLGPQYADADYRGAIEGAGLRAETGDVVRATARLLAAGKIVGWFQGRAEFGPRALGNRSILTDPRPAEMKDVLNARVKRREGFRPFAPAVLAERRDEYFDGGYPSPFMLLVENVRPAKRAELGAVTHVDGTARVQDVSRDSNPRFYDLIAEFGRITGTPVLLNTSFNLRGEPIVNTPQEAIAGFQRMDMDALVLGDYLLRKQETGG
jgi:carbamoyltransferase